MVAVPKEQSAERWTRVRLASWWVQRPTKATIGSRTERLNGHIGTKTRPRLLREAAVEHRTDGGNPDAATPRVGRRFSDCKPLFLVKIMTVTKEKAPRLTTCQQPRKYVGSKRCPDLLGVKGA